MYILVRGHPPKECSYSYSLALLPLWKTDSESLGVKFLLFILQLAGHSVTCGMAGAADRVCVPV